MSYHKNDIQLQAHIGITPSIFLYVLYVKKGVPVLRSEYYHSIFYWIILSILSLFVILLLPARLYVCTLNSVFSLLARPVWCVCVCVWSPWYKISCVELKQNMKLPGACQTVRTVCATVTKCVPT